MAPLIELSDEESRGAALLDACGQDATTLRAACPDCSDGGAVTSPGVSSALIRTSSDSA